MRSLALLLVVVTRLCASDTTISEATIARLKHSVIPIVCGYLDETHQFHLVAVAGSGFFVDRLGRFITARHVLNNWEEISRNRHTCNPAVYIPHDGWQHAFTNTFRVESFDFTNCQVDETIDLVLCELRENPFTSARTVTSQVEPVSFSTDEQSDGTPVAFTGFPLENTVPITSKGDVAGKTGIAGTELDFDYIIDKAAWPGASGSPVYLADGRVIGIVLRGGINAGSGLAYARSATVIRRFIDKHISSKK